MTQKNGILSMTATELLTLQFCRVSWCEHERSATHEHLCVFHEREQQRHDADMLSLDDPPDAVPYSVRFAILQRDTYRCRLCGAAARDGAHVRLEVDHITPRSAGGTNAVENLWTLCFACNRGKGAKEL